MNSTSIDKSRFSRSFFARDIILKIPFDVVTHSEFRQYIIKTYIWSFAWDSMSSILLPWLPAFFGKSTAFFWWTNRSGTENWRCITASSQTVQKLAHMQLRRWKRFAHFMWIWEQENGSAGSTRKECSVSENLMWPKAFVIEGYVLFKKLYFSSKDFLLQL